MFDRGHPLMCLVVVARVVEDSQLEVSLGWVLEEQASGLAV